MDDRDRFDFLRAPSATRPLLGLTVLAVEDSRYTCEALRLLCQRSGARLRRADSLGSARRHLAVYRPSVLVVDMGLPDGPGAQLIAEAAATGPRIAVILGISGDPFAENAALAAGADAFLAKPLSSLSVFQETVLGLLPEAAQPSGPRTINEEILRPDPVAFRDDMAQAAELLGNAASPHALDHVARFVAGVARSAGDGPLAAAAEELVSAGAQSQPSGARAARLAGMVHARLEERLAI